jgi:hypothetical protein
MFIIKTYVKILAEISGTHEQSATTTDNIMGISLSVY